jgi:hypothetical protein
MMLKHQATNSPAFQQTLANPRGISFGSGDPNKLMATSGYMSQQQMKAYTLQHGPMEAFMCELVLSYLYQYWESIIRPKLNEIIGANVESDVFGDMRIVRHALQHEKHKHIADSDRAKNIQVWSWLKEKAEARLTGGAFDAIMYSISLELHKLNLLWGNGPANITAIPSFFSGPRHFGLRDMKKADVKNFSKITWYKDYVLDVSKSNILQLEKAVLGDLHS